MAYATITVNWLEISAKTEGICICGGAISGLSTSDAYVDFEMDDGPFHKGLIFIINKSDMLYNTQSAGKNGEFVGIIENAH